MSKLRYIATATIMAMLASFVSAATTNNAAGGTAVAASLEKGVVLVGTADFSVYPCAAGDVVKVINIPSNFMVQAVTAYCLTTNTGTASAFLVGDKTATNTFRTTAISMITCPPGTAITQCTNSFANGGLLYTAPDFISVVPTIAVTNGKAVVRAFGCQMGP